MKLTDLAQSKALPPGVCGVCAARRVMTVEQLDALDTVLRNPNLAYTMIAESLHDEGFERISDSVVGKHARGKCKLGIRYR